MKRLVPLAGLIAIGCGSPAPDAPVEAVFLPSGASFAQMTDSLVAHRIVTNRRTFNWLARIGRFDRKLKAGFYEIKQGESPWRVLQLIAAGSEKTFRITIPRGLIREMAMAFRKGWDPSWEARRTAAGLSRRDLVTLASIVEGEARVDEDRALVAAVYLNRLRLRMPLQADPTVQYAMQRATGKRKTRLFERDYRFPSEYNTYLRAGLPPSPVGAPSLKSIEAVLAPAPVPYLFFVAGLDGKHVFTRTYGEHLRAIAKIRAAERAARRNRPPEAQ